MSQLIYRRLVLLAGAKAEVQPLARCWGVIIQGYVGRNSIKVLEAYNQRTEARKRRGEINYYGCALVSSVEDILYPLALIVAKYSQDTNAPLPPPPPPNRLLSEYTLVSEVYKDSPTHLPTLR